MIWEGSELIGSEQIMSKLKVWFCGYNYLRGCGPRWPVQFVILTGSTLQSLMFQKLGFSIATKDVLPVGETGIIMLKTTGQVKVDP